MPNQDQTMSLIRAALMFVGNMLIAKGLLSSGDASVLATAVVAGLGAIFTAWPIIWGLLSHSHDAMIHAVNAADNGRKVVDKSSPSPMVETASPLK